MSIWWPPIRGIEESWLYQEYYQKGFAEGLADAYDKARLEQARADVLLFGRTKFGPPTDAASDQIAQINDRDQLVALLLRVLDVPTWDELIATAAS